MPPGLTTVASTIMPGEDRIAPTNVGRQACRPRHPGSATVSSSSPTAPRGCRATWRWRRSARSSGSRGVPLGAAATGFLSRHHSSSDLLVPVGISRPHYCDVHGGDPTVALPRLTDIGGGAAGRAGTVPVAERTAARRLACSDAGSRAARCSRLKEPRMRGKNHGCAASPNGHLAWPVRECAGSN